MFARRGVCWQFAKHCRVTRTRARMARLRSAASTTLLTSDGTQSFVPWQIPDTWQTGDIQMHAARRGAVKDAHFGKVLANGLLHIYMLHEALVDSFYPGKAHFVSAVHYVLTTGF